MIRPAVGTAADAEDTYVRQYQLMYVRVRTYVRSRGGRTTSGNAELVPRAEPWSYL